jgi:hypothetical protein
MIAPRTIHLAAAFAPFAFAALLIDGDASAEATNPQVSRAIVLFELGHTELEAERYAEALPKFMDSERLDPGAGTMLNIAYCFEKLGKTATAWADYREAAVLAHEEGKLDWEQDALERAETLEKSLPRVVVQVDEPKDDAWPEVLLDDTPLPRSLWGEPTPVDPGHHEVLAKAAARRPWTKAFEVDAEGVPMVVVVPVLEPVDVVETVSKGAGTVGDTAGTARRERAGAWTSRRTAAIVVGGAGIAALGVGVGLGLLARSTYVSASTDCMAGSCGPAGAQTQSRAFTERDAAGVTVAVGGAAVLGAALLWFAQGSPPGGVQVQPRVGISTCGASLAAAW